MDRLHIGDEVRVVAPSSQWRDWRGTLVEVVNRGVDENRDVQEYAVDFRSERRWFLAEHLVKVVPSNMIRFFKTEAIDCWKLDAQAASDLDGTRDQLIVFLRDHHGFSLRRAESEVDQFLRALDDKIRRARDYSPHGTRPMSAA